MKHYKAIDGQVYGYETDGTQDVLIANAIANKWQDITFEEAKVHLASLQLQYVPQVISKVQAVLSFSRAGIWPVFETYLNADNTPMEHKLAWSNITEVRRDSPMLSEISGILALTDRQFDDLFIAADQIKI